MDSILCDVHNRFVMFPIKYHQVWNMYKKAQSVFWTAEELDLTKDIDDWEKLTQNEQYFLKHIRKQFSCKN